jgi:hypothetical protein
MADRKCRLYVIESKDFHEIVSSRTHRLSFTMHSSAIQLPLDAGQKETLEENARMFITGSNYVTM